MPKPNADEFPPYGPVPYEIRKPLVHRDPPQLERRPMPWRPMPDLRASPQDHRLLQNKSTEQENKTLKNNSLPANRIEEYRGLAPTTGPWTEQNQPDYFEQGKKIYSKPKPNTKPKPQAKKQPITPPPPSAQEKSQLPPFPIFEAEPGLDRKSVV